MSAINVTQVSVLGNPAPYTHPFQFEISYECLYALQDGETRNKNAEWNVHVDPNTKQEEEKKDLDSNTHLEWKIVYVGSAEDEQYDQTLDSVLVGPVGVGSYRFVFQANPPDWTKIPPMDITGVTVILLTCAYRGKEFIRVGYYVNNEYIDEQLQQEPPQVPEIEKIQRSILADKPRVTKFPISFDDVEEERNNTTMYAAAPPPENNDAEAMQV